MNAYTIADRSAYVNIGMYACIIGSVYGCMTAYMHSCFDGLLDAYALCILYIV